MDRTIGCGRCPVVLVLNQVCKILRGRGPISRRSFVTSFTHHARPQPSRASWRLASRLTRTFQGQLFHSRFASAGRYGPRAHRLPAQAMGFSTHYIIAPRGAHPSSSPFGKGSVDVGVVDGRLAMRVFRDRQALPWHPGVEHPQDEVKDGDDSRFCTAAPVWASRGAAR